MLLKIKKNSNQNKVKLIKISLKKIKNKYQIVIINNKAQINKIILKI